MKKTVVTLITAAKLTPQNKKEVLAVLEPKLGSIDIEEVIDPSVMGGLKIQLGNQEFDATLSGKLKRIESIVPEVVVTTAIELSDSQRKKITTALEEKLGALTIKEVVDPSVIGGIKIVAGSKEVDATVKGKLDKLKQQLLNTL